MPRYGAGLREWRRAIALGVVPAGHDDLGDQVGVSGRIAVRSELDEQHDNVRICGGLQYGDGTPRRGVSAASSLLSEAGGELGPPGAR
jgi:hypothetical protein